MSDQLSGDLSGRLRITATLQSYNTRVRPRPRPPLPLSRPCPCCCLGLARPPRVGDGGRVRGSNQRSESRFPPIRSRITTRWQSSRKRMITFGLMGPARFCDQERHIRQCIHLSPLSRTLPLFQ
jgi:hypothetical protein